VDIIQHYQVIRDAVKPECICMPHFALYDCKYLLLNYLQIGAPPPALQVAQLGLGRSLIPFACTYFLTTEPALTIILEYSFSVWFQNPSDGCLAAAISQYKTSPNCKAVMQAVDTIFSYDGFDHLRDVAVNRDVFRKKLVQIALNNRLCMSSSIEQSMMLTNSIC